MTSKNLTIVVTGGSNGIGEGICRHFLHQGATVINIDVQAARQELGANAAALAQAAVRRDR